MRKRLTMLLATTLLMMWGTESMAAQPTTINYSGRDSTFTGKKYKYYTVRCSDGKKRHITLWEEGGKKWCVGKGADSKCSSGQLKAAARACR